MPDLGERPGGGGGGGGWAPRLSWVKKEEMPEGRKDGWASQNHAPKSGSATGTGPKISQMRIM